MTPEQTEAAENLSMTFREFREAVVDATVLGLEVRMQGRRDCPGETWVLDNGQMSLGVTETIVRRLQ